MFRLAAIRALALVPAVAAAADAAAKLLQADRLDPRNPEIQTLLGEAAMKAAPAMNSRAMKRHTRNPGSMRT